MRATDMRPADTLRTSMFVVARNPKSDTRLPYLLYLPVAGERPLVLATSDAWPQGRDLFCLQLEVESWPARPEVLDTVPVQSCWRAGKAVHLVLKRRQRRRSMFIWTESRGRTLVFWRTQQTMQAARPGIRVPTARGLERRTISIAVDHRERYPWKFPRQHASMERRELPVGDYGVFFGDRLVAAVERKSMTDLTNAISSGTLRMQLAELSSLPRGILVVEGRLSDLVKAEKEVGVSAGWLLNVVAALQAEYPGVQWLFAETRSIAQDMAYRWLSAAVVVLREKYEAQDDPNQDDWQPASPSLSGIAPTASATGAVAAVAAVAEDPAGWNPVGRSMKLSDAGAIYVKDRLGRQREALLLAHQGRAWTVRSYQEHFQVSTATAYKDLEALVQQGDLTPVGSRRPKQYICMKEEGPKGSHPPEDLERL